jgi:hypothetical protein
MVTVDPVIALPRGPLARLRLALLCAALALLGGAPSAQALAESPRPAAISLVTAAPAPTTPSRRERRPVRIRVAAAPIAPRPVRARSPDLPQRPAAPPPYLAFHALLR